MPIAVEFRTNATGHASVGPVGQHIRIVVASNVRLVREGLSKSLRGRDRLLVGGSVDLQAGGMATLAQAQPDIIVIDIAGGDAMTIAGQMRQACPQAKLVAFALAEVDTAVFACAEAGFSSYLPREGGANELHQAILDAANGRMRCAPHIAAAMFSRLADLAHRPAAIAMPSVLTARENEILALADQGRSNKDIARRLSISDATVKNHMHNILQKLQVNRRGEAVARRRAGA